jgi:serine/threonine-protein phosphatase 2A activator
VLAWFKEVANSICGNLDLNIPPSNMSYKIPQRAILSQEQLEYFQTSKTRQEIVSFVESLNESVVGVKLTDECSESTVRNLSRLCELCLNEFIQGVIAILRILDSVEQIVKHIPPVDNSASRFGNPAFRTFYDKVSEVGHT